MWKDLNMQERSEVISLALKQGIYSLKDIRDLYDNSNQFEDGGFRLVGYRNNKPLYTNGTIDSSTGSPMLFDENHNPLSGKTFIYNLPAAEKTSTRKAQESAIKLRNPLAEATPEQVLSASTLGADKWIQPSWYAGMIRRSLQGKDATQDFIYGNTGVINEGYAEKHPYITTATNLVTDMAIPGAFTLVPKVGRAIGRTVDALKIYNGIDKNMSSVQNPINNRHIRTLVGDVEIDDPILNYRVGTKEIIDDFLKVGKVRGGKRNARNPQASKKVRFILEKEFENPMFEQGRLFFKPSEKKNGLLVTSQPLTTATSTSMPAPNNGIFTINGITTIEDFGGRRIPGFGQILDRKNTSAYIWEPNYGFRQVWPKAPSTKKVFFTN